MICKSKGGGGEKLKISDESFTEVGWYGATSGSVRLGRLIAEYLIEG